MTADYCRLAKIDVPDLVQAVRQEEGGLLILSADQPLLQAGAFQVLLDKLHCPLLLVR